MTAPASSDVADDLNVYPVYVIQVDALLMQVSFASSVQGGIAAGNEASVETAESFLEAMGAWAHGTYGAATVEVNKVMQSTSTLYSS